jgi:5'(3')-deoxyribonucleotidase
MEKRIVYVDMDNVLVDFKSALDILEIEAPKILEEYKGRADEIPNIFSMMIPMSGAIESFNFLSENFDTYILSTAPWMNPSAWSDKLNWVHKYLGESAHKRLILTHNKNLNKGDFLIDDRDKNGASKFEGELIKFGSTKFPDWDVVMEYMKSKIV